MSTDPRPQLLRIFWGLACDAAEAHREWERNRDALKAQGQDPLSTGAGVERYAFKNQADKMLISAVHGYRDDGGQMRSAQTVKLARDLIQAARDNPATGYMEVSKILNIR